MQYKLQLAREVEVLRKEVVDLEEKYNDLRVKKSTFEDLFKK